MNDNQLDNICGLINDSQNITVFTGAGVSTSCGIPDFRGESGLYAKVREKYNLPNPESIFDINYFHTDPAPFFDLSREFFGDEVRPSVTHEFIAWLERQGKISLVMTQNIDMLHQRAGTTKIIECHGTFTSAHCLQCHKEYAIEEIEPVLREGQVTRCDCEGLIKPDIVFFGEQLPTAFYKAMQHKPESDLIMVLGTSLLVQPAASFPLQYIQEGVPSLIVNLEETPYDPYFTYAVHDDLDCVMTKVWEKLENE